MNKTLEKSENMIVTKEGQLASYYPERSTIVYIGGSSTLFAQPTFIPALQEKIKMDICFN